MGKIVRFKKKKKKKKSGWKLIPHWSGVYTARSDANYHNCDKCEGPILKGFEYERNVYGATLANGKKVTITERVHSSPPCEMFFPPDDEDERSDKESLDHAA
ncbi:MAG: hypothetical protein ACD_67C00248G0002 [uncultured bacterium]|nr:MAG: hypothetical protein ACD_67C00248G0002 [uncultured bacterium]